MSREDLPHIPFYIGDWRRDMGIQSLSYHYRGIWFELLMMMYCSDQRGKLVLGARPMSDESIARMLGLSHEEWAKARHVLLAAGVPSVDDTGSLYCRRMVRDEEIRQSKAANGQKGGQRTSELFFATAKVQAKPKQNSDIDIGNGSGDQESRKAGKEKAGKLEEVTAFCKEIGLHKTDAEWFWHKCEANGWLNGGKRILDWRQTLRSWKAGGFVPSIKNPRAGVVLPKPKAARPAVAPYQAHTPMDEDEFKRRHTEWVAKGRPLGEFPA